MATALKNLSEFIMKVPSAQGMKFGIVVSEWNIDITESLALGAVNTLIKHGCDKEDIIVKYVPGAFELALGAQFFAEYTDVDAIIALGCVIQGDTPHFDYVCQGATQGITDVMLTWSVPVAFGVLTTKNMRQAQERAGGLLGNKGDEAAVTAIKMAAMQIEMENDSDGHDNTPPKRKYV